MADKCCTENIHVSALTRRTSVLKGIENKSKIAVVKPLGVKDHPVKKLALTRQPLKVSNAPHSTKTDSLEETKKGRPAKEQAQCSEVIAVKPAVSKWKDIPELTSKRIVPIDFPNLGNVASSDVLVTVQQVDADDADDPFYCSEYAEDIFQYMQENEQMPYYSIPRNFLYLQSKVNSCHRAVLVDWLVQVHKKFRLLQETLHITVDTLDRFLKVRTVHVYILQYCILQ